MTSLTHPGRPSQPSGVTRIAAAIASVAAFFKQWADVHREMDGFSRSPDLGVRARRLMRSYY